MREGGTLKISIREAGDSFGRGVLVAVEDTGEGIPAANLPRLFEPFFTTKLNAGTGLGLWVVRQFVASWGGTISVHSSSEPDNHGTTFAIVLPLVSLPEKQAGNLSAPVM
jgi:signal transduction histidine kinase